MFVLNQRQPGSLAMGLTRRELWRDAEAGPPRPHVLAAESREVEHSGPFPNTVSDRLAPSEFVI